MKNKQKILKLLYEIKRLQQELYKRRKIVIAYWEYERNYNANYVNLIFNEWKQELLMQDESMPEIDFLIKLIRGY